MPYKDPIKKKAYYERTQKHYQKNWFNNNREQWNKYQRERKRNKNQMATLYECEKLALMIEPDAFINMNLRNNNWYYYRCMVLFIYGTLNRVHDVDRLQEKTKFNKSTIKIVCENLSENGIWKDGLANVDFKEGEEWMEIILCTMCAMGELKRHEEIPPYPVPAIPLPMMPQFKIIDQFLLNERILLKQTLEEIRMRRIEREREPYVFKTYDE